MKIIALALISAVMLLLSACQSSSPIDNYQQTNTQDTSNKGKQGMGTGFLSDYTRLKKVKGIDGEEVLRWSNSELKDGRFSKIMLDPVEVFPIEAQSVEISEETRAAIKQYFGTQLRSELSKHYELSEQPGSDVAQVRLAITGIELNSEGMKVTEFLPYGAVIGLVRTATGTRNQEVNVVLEMEILNSETAEPVLALVRMGEGENVRMLWDANFSIENVKSLLDEWLALAVEGFSVFAKK